MDGPGGTGGTVEDPDVATPASPSKRQRTGGGLARTSAAVAFQVEALTMAGETLAVVDAEPEDTVLALRRRLGLQASLDLQRHDLQLLGRCDQRPLGDEETF